MRAIDILKKLITLYYYLMLIALVASVIGISTILFTRNNMDADIMGLLVNFTHLNIVEMIVIIILITGLYYLYIRALYLLKNSLNDLSKGHYFSPQVTGNFRSIGKLLLVSGAYNLIGRIIIGFLVGQRVSIMFDSVIFLFLLAGLFFLFLSEVFAKGIEMQEENDLTI